jgi:hypothetical protein
MPTQKKPSVNFLTPSSKFDPSRLFLFPIINDAAKQDMIIIKYYYGNEKLSVEKMREAAQPLIVLTDEMVISYGGIPKYSEDFHDHELSLKRAFMYIVYDKEQENSVAFFNFVKQIDDYVCEGIKEGGFLPYFDNKKVKYYDASEDYTSIIGHNKKPKKGNTDNYVKRNRIKAKFSIKYDASIDADKRDIDTQVFDIGSSKPLKIKNIVEYQKNIPYRGTYRYGIQFAKIYMTINGKSGLGLKIKQIQIIDRPQRGESSNISINMFSGKQITDDEIEDTEGTNEASGNKNDDATSVASEDKDDDAEDGSDGESSGGEESSDDESSDDGETSDDDDEDSKPSKKASRGTKSQRKQSRR